MYTLFLTLTILVIISQTLHTYFVFISFSRLEGNLRLIQAIIFCSILSVSILAFVLIRKPNLAILGAIIEIIINMYYYAEDFWKNGIRAKVHRWKSIITFWRRNWVSIFFGILIPILIYVFSEQMIELSS